MPLLEDDEKTLLEFSISHRQTPGPEILSVHRRDQEFAGWSEEDLRRVHLFNKKDHGKNLHHFKEYPWAQQTSLKILPELPPQRLESLLEKRRSQRNLSESPVSFEELSSLLYYPNHILENNLRTQASGGARYPLEVYIYVLRVEGLPSGLYHYNLHQSTVEHLPLSTQTDFMQELFKDSKDVASANFIVFTTAVAARSSVKYGYLSSRLIYLEAGQLSQSLWLVATALELKSWPIARLPHKAFHRLLGINSHQEFFVFCQVFGR